MPPVKYWETVADNSALLSWPWGYCSAVTRDGWRSVVDAHKTTPNAISSNLTSSPAHFWSWKRLCLWSCVRPSSIRRNCQPYWPQSQNHQSKFIFRLVSAVS